MIVLDIETAPDFEGALFKELHAEKQQGDPYPAFDPAEVKTGNIKDPKKIADKIEESRIKHAKGRVEHDEKQKEDLDKWVAGCAIDPLLGRIMAIGWRSTQSGISQILTKGSEASILEAAWEAVGVNSIAGWNIRGFDIPFMVQRSRILGIEYPKYAVPLWKEYKIIDLMDEWSLGNDRKKLAHVAKALGLNPKFDLKKDFGVDYHYQLSSEDLHAYLKRDVEIEYEIAKILCPAEFPKPEPEEDGPPY